MFEVIVDNDSPLQFLNCKGMKLNPFQLQVYSTFNNNKTVNI